MTTVRVNFIEIWQRKTDLLNGELILVELTATPRRWDEVGQRAG